jgi:Phosphoesterase family
VAAPAPGQRARPDPAAPRLLPFTYSLARTFTVADRWFGAAPCQTFPNRRFLLAGTAYGNVTTSVASLFDRPVQGLARDRPAIATNAPGQGRIIGP